MKVFVALAALVAVASAATIEPSLKMKLTRGEKLDINIVLDSIDDIYTSPALLAMDKEARITSMIKSAKARTTAAQQPFLEVLAKSGKTVETFWISNEIFVKNADLATLTSILNRVPGDYLVREPVQVHLVDPVEVRNATEAEIQQTLQWGVEAVRADAAWPITRGEGAVVAIIDTGVFQGHAALSSNYAGAWNDPYYGNANPTDTHGHGTHALGSAVGTANGIGVAPGARWIACRGLNNQGSGTNAALLSCAQWTLNANPRPNVVSNSWGGGAGNTFYNSAINAWRAAGIVPVFAIGNAGSACGSANSPGDQVGVISVGATGLRDVMASFSSRGPGPSNRQKPEVSAPGANIVSASSSGANQYATMSGTSMATPHVAGAVALIISRQPNIGVDAVASRLQTTAAHPTVSNADRNCGSTEWPNMAFGHGRIDAAAALP